MSKLQPQEVFIKVSVKDERPKKSGVYTVEVELTSRENVYTQCNYDAERLLFYNRSGEVLYWLKPVKIFDAKAVADELARRIKEQDTALVSRDGFIHESLLDSIVEQLKKQITP